MEPLQDLRTKLTFEDLKELLNYPGFSQSLSEEGDRSRIGNAVYRAKTGKRFDGALIIDLKQNLLIADIEEPLKKSACQRGSIISLPSFRITLPVLRVIILE